MIHSVRSVFKGIAMAVVAPLAAPIIALIEITKSFSTFIG
ncbi:hypothetical protein J2Z37_000307 [Ammoniphilus resinae]|uniref:Uncharacterized protein n=1 Tax=Ammoniphilus resinae TaxID=861532 RepID=A0ABS4GJ88_9BACL|nr:hypothetical protein [Ammoniphilus resinae]